MANVITFTAIKLNTSLLEELVLAAQLSFVLFFLVFLFSPPTRENIVVNKTDGITFS